MGIDFKPWCSVLAVVSLGGLVACSGGGGSNRSDGGSGGSSYACTASTAATGNDPMYGDQWHLNNTAQADEDINIEPAWLSVKGAGVCIAIVDDGLEIAHADLAANAIAGGSYDYLTGDNDPTGGKHGTSVAGVAAAVGYNDVGVRGVAPSAGLVGYNLLQSYSTANAGDAMTRGQPGTSIYSNSWGPPDDTGRFIDSDSVWRASIETGISSGRDGKGSIYTWAAGNGADNVTYIDNSNHDGFANHRGVMAVAAVKNDGTRATYSEEGANLWLSAPAGDVSCSVGSSISTVDRTGTAGYNLQIGDYLDTAYTRCFAGTSAATPMVSGAAALVLQANPSLTWRDVRILLARTARKNDPTDGDWVQNNGGIGRWVNHKYGFGVVDAGAAVTAAGSWVNVDAALTAEPSSGTLNTVIPDNDATGISPRLTVSGSTISEIEWVDVTVNSDHAEASDLEITLTTPSGTSSQLSATHSCSGGCGAALNGGWRFGVARHLDETVINGDWTLTIKDNRADNTGNLVSWSLKIYGH